MTSLPETMSQIRSFVMWIRVSWPHAPKYCPDWSSLEVFKLRTCSEIGRKNAENQPVQKRPLLREDYVPEMVDSIIAFVHLDLTSFNFFKSQITRAVVLSISFAFATVTPRIWFYDVIIHKDRNVTSWTRKVTWFDIRKGPRLVARGSEEKLAGNMKGNASNSGFMCVQFGRSTT